MINHLSIQCNTLDPFLIAENYDIEVRYVPFSENPKGQFINLFEKPMILLNESIKDSERRYYVMAHELYHALEHSSLAGYYVSTGLSRSKLEYVAYRFAATFLLDHYVSENGTMPDTFGRLQLSYGVDELMADYLEISKK